MDPRTQHIISEISGKVDRLLYAIDSGATPSALPAPAPAPPVPPEAPKPTALDESLLSAIATSSAILDERKLCSEIVAGALQLTMAERGFIMVMHGRKLHFITGLGITSEMLAGPDFNGSRSVIKDAMQSGTTIIKSDEGNDITQSMKQGSLGTALCVPIPVGTRVKMKGANAAGIIYVDSQSVRGISKLAEERLEIYARHATIALENARLFGKKG